MASSHHHDDDTIDDRVYQAVIANEPPDEVRRPIDELAQGDDARRSAAVNKAGINEQSGEEETPLQAADRLEEGGLVGALLVAGADFTRLLVAAELNTRATRREVVEELLRRSSAESRRAVDIPNGFSAIGWLVHMQRTSYSPMIYRPFEPWHLRIVAELQRSGATVKRHHAAILVPSAVRRGAELAAELAARRSESRRRRAHDCFVQLAFDQRDAREDDEGVWWREASVRELEEKLRELGGEEVKEEEEESAAPSGASCASWTRRRRRGGVRKDLLHAVGRGVAAARLRPREGHAELRERGFGTRSGDDEEEET